MMPIWVDKVSTITNGNPPELDRPEFRERLAPACGPLVFPAPSGKALPVRRFSARYWRPAAKISGFATVTPHQLRHLHATQLLELGRPITEVAVRLGHRNPRVTMDVYARWIQPDDSAAAAVVPDYSSALRAVEAS
jgi:integrase